MKKIILAIALAFAAFTAHAASDALVTYFGETEPVVEVRGSSWLGDYSSLEW